MNNAMNIFDTYSIRPDNITKRFKDKAAEKNDGFKRLLDESVKNSAPESRENKLPTNRLEKRLMDACLDMESIFVAKMLKEMRNTVHKSKLLHGGFAEEIFEDMLYDKYSLELSKTADLGIARMLYKELSRKL